jgi:hypothetical protein
MDFRLDSTFQTAPKVRAARAAGSQATNAQARPLFAAFA